MKTKYIIAVIMLAAVLWSACSSLTDEAIEPLESDELEDAPGETVEGQTSEVDEPGSERGQGATLRMYNDQAPTIANPHLSPGTKDLIASRVTYEPLATFDKDGVMVPILAAEIPSLENGQVAPDGTSVTWTLKQGVMWADGEPFTADDVLFTYEYVTNPDVGSTSTAAYTEIDNIEVIDDHTLTINFGDSTGGWYSPFVGPLGMIIPRHVFEEYSGPNAGEAPANLMAVGTGPYYVTEFLEEDILIIGTNAVSTVRITYDINPYYREPDKPYFSTVEYRGGGDPVFSGNLARDGVVDYAYSVGLRDEDLAAIEAVGNSVLIIAPQSFVERIMLNFTDPNQEAAGGERASIEHPHPFLTDPAVRQAIALGINREAVADIWGLAANLSANILVEPPETNSQNTSVEYNPQQAMTLLDEAGWVDSDDNGVRDKDGVSLSLIYQTSIEPLRQSTQEQVKADLEAIGFDVELKQIDGSIFFGPPEGTTDTRRQFYADFEEFAFSNKSPDPTAYMAGWTCAEISQQSNNWSGSNWARYCNPEYDALFEQVTMEIDPERRAELFIELNDILIEDNAVIPLAHRNFANFVSTDLRGYDFTPWDVDPWNIADWHRESE